MNKNKTRELILIGATAAPNNDELPQYLDPVCIDPAEPDRCYVAHVAPWDCSRPQLREIPRGRFEEECDSGYWQRLNGDEAFEWSYRLVALDADKPPVYLPDEQAYSVVQERGEAALEAVALDLERNVYRDMPDERIWYAARALPADPLPLLAAIALERDRLPPETLSDLEADLPPPSRQASPLVVLARQRGWNRLLDLVSRDRKGSEYFSSEIDPGDRRLPQYLAGVPEKPNFLSNFQRQLGRTYAFDTT